MHNMGMKRNVGVRSVKFIPQKSTASLLSSVCDLFELVGLQTYGASTYILIKKR